MCTYRNNLNKILMTLHGDLDWAIDCCKWGNTLFLDINKSAGNVIYAGQDKMTYYGYKFEAICTSTHALSKIRALIIKAEFCQECCRAPVT